MILSQFLCISNRIVFIWGGLEPGNSPKCAHDLLTLSFCYCAYIVLSVVTAFATLCVLLIADQDNAFSSNVFIQRHAIPFVSTTLAKTMQSYQCRPRNIGTSSVEKTLNRC